VTLYAVNNMNRSQQRLFVSFLVLLVFSSDYINL